MKNKKLPPVEMTMRCQFFIAPLQDYTRMYGEQLVEIEKLGGKPVKTIETLDIQWVEPPRETKIIHLQVGQKIPAPAVACAIYYEIPVSKAKNLTDTMHIEPTQKLTI